MHIYINYYFEYLLRILYYSEIDIFFRIPARLIGYRINYQSLHFKVFKCKAIEIKGRLQQDDYSYSMLINFKN